MDSSKLRLFLTFIIFSIILSIASISADNFFFGDTTQKIALKNAIDKVKERETVFKNFFSQSEATLQSIRNLELFKKYLENKINHKVLEDIFLSYSKSQPNFMQLRYIDKNGNEKIKIDRKSENLQPYIVPQDKLQNKKNRYYFSDSKKKPLEKIWFSDLDLNIEHGKVEIPFKPTARAMYPIKYNGKFDGILIINYSMKNFLHNLFNAPLYDMILFDAKGFPLVHYQKAKSWGFYLPSQFNLSKDFPNKIKQILSSDLYISNNFISKKLDLPLGDRLYLILKLKKSYLKKQLKQKNEQHLMVAGIILIFSFLLSILIVKKFSTTLLNLKKIKELNENLNSASKIAKIGFFEYYSKVDNIIWSPGVYNIFEIEDENKIITKEYLMDFFLTEEKENILNQFQQSIDDKKEFFLIHKIKIKHNIKTVEQRAKHYYDSYGKYYKSIGSIYDVTQIYEQQQMLSEINREIEETNDELQTSLENLSELHTTLEEEKLKYKNILDFASDGIHILNDQGNIVECSHSFANMLGYSINEIYSLNIKEWDIYFSEQELDQVLDKLKQSLQKFELESKTIETKHRKKDGTIIDVQINVKNIKINNNIFLYASSRDITDQKNIQRKLQEQKDEFEAVFNYSKEGIAITNLKADFLQANDAYLKLTGFTKEEILTKNCYELTVKEDQPKNEAAFKAAIEYGFIENFEKRCIVKGGKEISIMLTISLLPDKERLLLVAKDMTTLKLLEEQSKLASMGEMIGNIAHQWRQPLSIITTSASALEVKSDYSDITKEDITEFSHIIVDQSMYLSKTIDDFKNFIKGDLHYAQISLKEVIEETLRLTDASIKGNFIKTILDIEDDQLIYGNKNELTQAFINILNNAKDALKEIDDNTQTRYIFISTKQIDNVTIELTFLDNAGGIKDTVIGKIFEPYFTTKHKSLGTGLGLSMTDKIIRQRHKGTLRVFNKEYSYQETLYKGACFVLTFRKQEN